MKAGATLDYDTATSYTLSIQAFDGGAPNLASALKTITIGLIENGEAVYSISESGDTLTAELDTADPDGVNGAVSYQWFTTTDGGITKDAIATSGTNSIADTTSQSLNTDGHTLPDPRAVYIVEITYEDGEGFTEVVEATTPVLPSITLEDDTFTTTNTIAFTSIILFTLNPIVVGGGDVSYSFGGTDGSLFEVSQGRIFFKGSLGLEFAFTKVTYEFTVTATESAGGTSDTATFTLNTGYVAASPAQIPDRQAEAHDPYDLELGLTPIPEVDPNG